MYRIGALTGAREGQVEDDADQLMPKCTHSARRLDPKAYQQIKPIKYLISNIKPIRYLISDIEPIKYLLSDIKPVRCLLLDIKPIRYLLSDEGQVEDD